MVRLKSRYQCPVGGFQFVDAPISDQPIQTWDFNEMVRIVQARRQQNPRFNLPTDQRAIEAEVDLQNAMRMLSISGAQSYITDVGPPPPNFTLPPSRSWRNAVGAVKQGSATLLDWLGDGGVPVPKEQSAKRALVCTACPLNGKGDWLSIFTKPVQELIQAQLSVKHDLNISTPYDEQLGVCNACACPLKLKVHTPIQHIGKHLSSDVKNKLDKGCWILPELGA